MGDHSHSLATVLCKSTKLPTYHPNPNSSRKSAILGHRYDSVDNLVQDFDMSCASYLVWLYGLSVLFTTGLPGLGLFAACWGLTVE